MNSTDIIHTFLKHPYPLWEHELAAALVEGKFKQLGEYNLSDRNEYSTARCINDYSIPLDFRLPIFDGKDYENIYIETFSESLKTFYEEHGLDPYSKDELQSKSALLKIKSAFTIFELVKPAYSCVKKLVRSIQVLHQEDKEIDTSYSHPKIPFSIFVSVCEDASTISNLRVAESVLHESMHLKLTLIESILPLVKPFTGNLYYSPWRDEDRPAQGILHGLFVFKAVQDFYKEIIERFKNKEIVAFLTDRIQGIEKEITSLHDFINIPDLTEEGKALTIRLL